MMRVELIKVTPKMAAEYMATNTRNRDIRQKRVEYFAMLMRENRFRSIGDAIMFDTQGRLMNGQHRLLAIMESDMAQIMVVLWDVDDSAFMVLDRGQRRTAAQALKMQGFVNAQTIAAGARWVLLYRDGEITRPRNTYSDHELIVVEVEKSPEMYDALATQAHAFRKAIRLVPSAYVAFGVIAYEAGYDDETIDEFINGIREPKDLQDGDPRLACWRWFAKEINFRQYNNAEQAIAPLSVLLKGFNRFANGTSLKEIKAWRAGHEFPSL